MASILKESMSILGENTYEALKFHMKEWYGIDLAHNPRLEDGNLRFPTCLAQAPR
jgi:hypothetical protein